ncbi:hypothetical protein [Glycomyces sp. NPDC048151]|uniref:hypothetical protein n=1 Tax=Glycomyces sp. NPDC048151 TaxID=3364002 RepID=UPI00371AA4D7
MPASTRRLLAVTVSVGLTALMAALPTHAQEVPPSGPVLEYASSTCTAAGDREVEFALRNYGDAAHVVASVQIQTGPDSNPWKTADLAGTLRKGTALAGHQTLTGTAVLPVGTERRVALKARLAPGGKVLARAVDLSRCEPAVPDEELEQPGRVWGPYGAKRTIPTHASPAGGQTTHPSVVKIPGGWNGYEYWMAHTPYPGSNDAWEDPNIAASHNGVNWEVPAGLTNPIDDQPGSPGPYNSDTDLQMGPNDTMYLFWRVVIPDLAQERIKYSTSTDGVHWSAPAEAMRSSMSVRRPLSPAFIYENGRWYMWAVDMVRSPNRIVYFVGGATPAKANWSAGVYATLGPMQNNKEPWHLSIVKDGNEYIGLLNDTVTGASGREGDLLFIAGSTPTNFASFPMSAIPRLKPGQHDRLYRATLYADTEYGKPGYRVWYSARIALNPDVWNVQQTFLHGADVHGSP